MTEIEDRRKKRVGLLFSVIALVGVGSIIERAEGLRPHRDGRRQLPLEAAAADEEKRIEAKAEQLRGKFKAKVEQDVLDQIENESSSAAEAGR